MGNIFSYIPKFLGLILNFIYEYMSFGRYGVAIILFTIFVKLILLPLTVKQYKSNAQLQEIQPIIQELQRKYKNDPQKLNEEMMKVYTEHKYNPASGCLPLLVQMPILFSLIYVIGKPMTYMLQYSPDQIAEKLENYSKADIPIKITGFYEQIGAVDYLGILNMKFFGLNLGLVPSWRPGVIFGPQMSEYLPLIIIPILAVTTTIISNKLMMAATMKKSDSNSANDKSQDMANAMSKNMMLIAPLMTLWVSFQFPAGLGLYWFVGNVFQIFQQLYLNKFVLKKKEV